MDWTNLLGIYPDAIEKVFDTCRDALQDISDFAEKLGYNKDAECLDIDLEDDVLDCLASNGLDVHDMTNALIDGCFCVTQGALKNTQFCKDFEITFDSYTNCDDSHLYFEHNGVTEKYHETGDMKELLDEILVEHLSDIICDRLIDSDRCSDEEITDEWVKGLKTHITDDLSYFDDEDIVACYRDWEITGTIRETVDDFLSAQRDAERKPSVERD